ncbi:hypothetical protein M5689_012701 [Euphorbia peplus]|nr:hypothetical protein M5689_012701 [Euphorbia peplus]
MRFVRTAERSILLGLRLLAAAELGRETGRYRQKEEAHHKSRDFFSHVDAMGFLWARMGRTNTKWAGLSFNNESVNKESLQVLIIRNHLIWLVVLINCDIKAAGRVEVLLKAKFHTRQNSGELLIDS